MSTPLIHNYNMVEKGGRERRRKDGKGGRIRGKERKRKGRKNEKRKEKVKMLIPKKRSS